MLPPEHGTITTAVTPTAGQGPVTPPRQGGDTATPTAGWGHGHPQGRVGMRSPLRVRGGDRSPPRQGAGHVTPLGWGAGAGHPRKAGRGLPVTPTVGEQGPVTPQGRMGHGHPSRGGAGHPQGRWTVCPPPHGEVGTSHPQGRVRTRVTSLGGGEKAGHPHRGGWAWDTATPHSRGIAGPSPVVAVGGGQGSCSPPCLLRRGPTLGLRGALPLTWASSRFHLQSIDGRLQTFFAHPQPIALARGQDCSWHMGLTFPGEHLVLHPSSLPSFATHRHWCPDRPAGPCTGTAGVSVLQVSFTVPEPQT